MTVSWVTERILREDKTPSTGLIMSHHDIVVPKNVISSASKQYKRIELVDSVLKNCQIVILVSKVIQITYVSMYISFGKKCTPLWLLSMAVV